MVFIAKTVKCRYQYCKHGELLKDEAIKINNLYYHKECGEEKETKQEIFNYYIERYQSKEPHTAIRKAIKQYVNEKNFDAKYVLYVLKQGIKLKGIFALIYYLNDSRMQEDYAKSNIKKVKLETKEIKTQESTSFQYNNKNKNRMWGDTICH